MMPCSLKWFSYSSKQSGRLSHIVQNNREDYLIQFKTIEKTISYSSKQSRRLSHVKHSIDHGSILNLTNKSFPLKISKFAIDGNSLGFLQGGKSPREYNKESLDNNKPKQLFVSF